MKPVALSLSIAAALAVFAWPAARGGDAEDGVCALMTPAKLLHHPSLAQAYAQALRSGDLGEVGRVEAMLREIRSAHGCVGDVSLPAAPLEGLALPPGHPPIPGRSLDGRGVDGDLEECPALPPGHPPIHAPSLDDRGTHEAPFSSAPGIVAI